MRFFFLDEHQSFVEGRGTSCPPWAFHHRPRGTARGAAVPTPGRDVGRGRCAVEPAQCASRVHCQHEQREIVSKDPSFLLAISNFLFKKFILK